MINVPDIVLQYFCRLLHIKKDSLEFIGGGREDSDGIVYGFHAKEGKRALKILAVPKQEAETLPTLDQRLEFAHLLGQGGIKLAFPLPSKNGQLYDTYTDGDTIFVAYSMRLHGGLHPATENLNPVLCYGWGKMTGRAHRIAKQLPTWKNLRGNPSEFGYQDEIDFFYGCCKDDFVKEKWLEMKQLMSALPIDRNSYGFIHNDNHQNNILVKDNDITLIDFDVAACQFFLQDISVPLQGILFDRSGGMCNQIINWEPLKMFLGNFMKGYETENRLDDAWIDQLTLFVNYRRLLLYTCMQGFLNENSTLKNGFLEMIKNPPSFDFLRNCIDCI